MTVEIRTGTLRAEILPAAGASIVSFDDRFGGEWVPLMRPTPPEAVSAHNVGQMASFNLAPWSNRIVGAAFEFQGRRYQLRANTPQGFAIHGDVRERPWRVTAQRGEAVTCSIDSRDFPDFNFPFPLVAEIQYALIDDAFDTTLTLTNVGDDVMPAGFGFHPYFNRGFGARDTDEAQLQLKASGVYPPLPGMTARPVGPAMREQSDRASMVAVPPDMDFSQLVPVGARGIDHCFGGWDGHATIAYPSAGVQLRFECELAFGHVIIYTPADKTFFAVEPVTHANDGFNLFAAGQPGNGIRVLQPGERLGGRFRIRVEHSQVCKSQVASVQE